MITTFTRFAIAGAAVAAMALPAAQASAADRTQSALIGAAVGALAGSLLGHGDTGAVVAGAAVGGIVGASAGRDRYHDYRGGYRTYEPARYAPRYDQYRPVYRTEYQPVSYRPYGYYQAPWP